MDKVLIEDVNAVVTRGGRDWDEIFLRVDEASSHVWNFISLIFGVDFPVCFGYGFLFLEARAFLF
jgi:hypothetical protein